MIRGYIISRANVLPTDRRFTKLMEDPALTAFTYHWLRKKEDDMFDRLSKLLGVAWKAEELEAFVEAKKRKKSSFSSSSIDDLYIPLALAINPKLLEGIIGDKKGVDGYTPGPNEEIIELGDFSRNKFLDVMGLKKKNNNKE